MKFLLCALVGIGSTWAQPGGGGRGPQVVSPEVLADHRVTFRILAPNAQAVTLNAGDIQATAWASASANAPAPANPGGGRGGRSLTKGENGVWELTTSDPVVPGAYRYVFNVDGVTTMDPRDTSISERHSQPAPPVLIYCRASQLSVNYQGPSSVRVPEKSGEFHNLGLTLRTSENIRNGTARN